MDTYSWISYLHTNGFIHRDIKAANLLVDDDGTVLLGDLGVAADLAEDTSHLPPSSKRSVLASSLQHPHSTTGSGTHGDSPKRIFLFDNAPASISERPRIRKRKSFVGTVC